MSKELGTLIASVLQAAGHKAAFAGGCVRDILLKRTPKDWDIATSATPEEVKALINPEVFKVIEVGKSFGVLKIGRGLEQIDVATFREESDYTDGRRPDLVQYTTSMLADACRRDFTINAMFMDPLNGNIYDPFGGRQDIELRRIIPVGNARKRFEEDHLRMMRAIRLSAQLDCQIPAEIVHLITEEAVKITKISKERQIQELTKICESPNIRHGIGLLNQTFLLFYILEERIDQMDFDRLMRLPDSYSSVEIVLATILIHHNLATHVIRSQRLPNKSVNLTTGLIGLYKAAIEGKSEYEIFKARELIGDQCPGLVGFLGRLDVKLPEFKASIGFESLIDGMFLSQFTTIKEKDYGAYITKGREAQYNREFNDFMGAVIWVRSQYLSTITKL